MNSLKLGMTFKELHSHAGLFKLDKKFLEFLLEYNERLYHILLRYRSDNDCNNAGLYSLEHSKFLISIAPILDDFIAILFDIEKENLTLKKEHKAFDIIYECRRQFVQRYAIKKYPLKKIQSIDFQATSKALYKMLGDLTEQSLAKSILLWQCHPTQHVIEIDLAAKYCAYMVHHNSSLSLFDIPRISNRNNLLRQHKIDHLRNAPTYLGFNYRDQEQSINRATMNAKYCIYCHNQSKDHCSRGNDKIIHNINSTSAEQPGCPLKQKISEMNLLKSQGFNIASLAIAMIDNPLLVLTGHRICNDCTKSCIYQKQDPVDIPLIESNILDQLLKFTWGVEIYLLLTRWNPLKYPFYLPKARNNKNVLITGLGPAGIAASYYLLQEGINVTAIDGLKIAPLSFDISQPIKCWNDIKINLSIKASQGFGGVAEYGITNRWDKNYLTIARIILERYNNFNLHGNIRLGSNITIQQAFEQGFDHIALCIGTGKPEFFNHVDYFTKGVRSAVDFLMNLQQGGAYIDGSNSNLLLRMPAVIIGCGLTAIDSAVEILHYYPIQVEKFLQNWEQNNNSADHLAQEDKMIAQEFITHAKLFRKCNNDEEKLRALNQEIGGVTICYRKRINQSPAYLRNHEEIEHAISIGIKFIENITPQKVHMDQYDHVKSVQFNILNGSNDQTLNAKSVLLAIGTNPNQFHDIQIANIHNDTIDNAHAIFKQKDRKISYFGDCNPRYQGSVVQAIASVKNGYHAILDTLSNQLDPMDENYISTQQKQFTARIDYKLKSYIDKINILSDTMLEIVVHAPLSVKNVRPGQFFKLQNHCYNIKDTIEPLALTPSYIDKTKSLLHFIISQIGNSTKLCSNLREGEEIALMGPTGAAINLVHNSNIMLIGSNVGNAALAPIGQALQTNKCNILYFAHFTKESELFYPDRIETIADRVIWSCEETTLDTTRQCDITLRGQAIDNIIDAKNNHLIQNIDYVILIGDNKLLYEILMKKQQLFDQAEIICAINTSMQCMMKGICGQCVQKTTDNRKYIFACSCLYQNIDIVHLNSLNKRLKHNKLLELLSL